MRQKRAKMFTSGRKHETLHIRVFRYADSKNMRNQAARWMVPAQNGGQSGEFSFLFNFTKLTTYMRKINICSNKCIEMSSVGCFYSCHTHSRYANKEKLILIPFGAPKGGISCNFTMFSGVKLKSERKIICIINNMYWCFNLRNSDIKVLDFCFNV